ncbi:MAG: YcxB family protein [Candidatus Kapabacteria bacterium]|nr:YcxB family protein [Candidatus Kapabacteria bacterium]
MDDKIIELKYCRTDFEEIYYRNGNDKTFLNSHLRKERNTFFVVSSIFVLTLIYIMAINENYGFLILIGVLLCFAFYDWYKKASHWIKWKKETELYLDDLDKIRENYIVLSKNAFSLIQDKKETIEKWTEFKRAEIEEDFISLISNTTTYLIPKKSMTPDEFRLLRKMLAEKIKNEL